MISGHPVVYRLWTQSYRSGGQSLFPILSGELRPLPNSSSASFALLQMVSQTLSKLSFGTWGWIHVERGKGANALTNRLGGWGILSSPGGIIFSLLFARMALSVLFQRCSTVYFEPVFLFVCFVLFFFGKETISGVFLAGCHGNRLKFESDDSTVDQTFCKHNKINFFSPVSSNGVFFYLFNGA